MHHGEKRLKVKSLKAILLTQILSYLGNAQIRNTEFFHSGQEGWTDSTDPRFSATFLNLGKVPQHSCTLRQAQHFLPTEPGCYTFNLRLLCF